MILGIIGNGFVGRATALLECKSNKVVIFDKNPDLCSEGVSRIEDMKICDIIFICVPTPMSKDGSCYLNILESVVEKLKYVTNSILVSRCTVPVGTSKRLDINYMPEFLTEKNWRHDFENTKEWVISGDNSDQIEKVINNAYESGNIKNNKIIKVYTDEAESIKMFRNVMLCVKISLSNELAEFCERKGLDYENIRKVVTLDDRIGDSHTHVPGHDGKRGFGGTCFPKDISSLMNQMEKISMDSYIIKATIERNNAVDRPQGDWKQEGRSII